MEYEPLRLSCQRTPLGLYLFITRTNWYRTFFIPVTTVPAYGYKEDIATRIIVSSHAAAHYFNLPYPTVICLLFQESGFAFVAKSHTGAGGLGQLTGIALKHIRVLREKPRNEQRLQAAASALRCAYQSTEFLHLLRKMGFKPRLPNLGTFPNEIEKSRLNPADIASEVQVILARSGVAYSTNRNLIEKLVRSELRGHVTPKGYAAVHAAVLQLVQDKFGSRFGNIYNIETNILGSCMILRDFYNYPWKVNGKRIRFNPCLRTIIAVAAYNQGPTPVTRYFETLLSAHPEIDPAELTIDSLRPYFRMSSVGEALNHQEGRTREIFAHVEKLISCTYK